MTMSNKDVPINTWSLITSWESIAFV